jgi:hypothetical protein
MKVSDCIVDCGIIEREVLELLHSSEASGKTHIIESAELMELYFIWPIPLIFDEFTMD